jgi:3-deoxy-D-manno-octulosonate 8-phosphate phosphatase (KDO 8-P phosphatase)
MNKTLKLFSKVKLLMLDVDGVLTRGDIIYDDAGRELKHFNVKDGLGVVLLNKVGIKTLIVTAKDGHVVRKRADDMRVVEVVAGVLPKESILPEVVKKYKVTPDEICFIGDDLIDVGLIEKVGVGVAVNDASALVKKRAKYVTRKRGGEGAVREVIDLIMKARNLEKQVMAWVRNPVL